VALTRSNGAGPRVQYLKLAPQFEYTHSDEALSDVVVLEVLAPPPLGGSDGLIDGGLIDDGQKIEDHEKRPEE
jgi:hypothetical protein